MSTPTDWNDLAAARGLEPVRQGVRDAVAIVPEQEPPATSARHARPVAPQPLRVVEKTGHGAGPPQEPPSGDDAAPDPARATHHDLALAWVAGRTIGAHPPVYAGGAVHVPDAGGLWRAFRTERIEVEVARQFNGYKLCKKRSDYTQIAAHVEALTEDVDFFESAAVGVTSPRGFHRLSSTGYVETVSLDLSHRQTFALAHGPETDADAPLMDELLAAAFEGDSQAEQQDLFWQCFGAALFGPIPRLQVAVLLLGAPRSGKSTIQRILESAFPRDAVSAVSPHQWNHEYHVAALANKRLNVVGELSDDKPLPAAAFKNVTGLNLVGARNPTHRPFSFRNAAAHVFASNVLPPTTDRTEAFYRRWRVLRFANTVPAERIDHTLLDKIAAHEMPAILAQAFQGAERVAKAGALRTTAAHEAALSKWRYVPTRSSNSWATSNGWSSTRPQRLTRPATYTRPTGVGRPAQASATRSAATTSLTCSSRPAPRAAC